MTTELDTLIDQAKELADARGRLKQIVFMLNEGIEALKADHMPKLRQAVDEASKAWSELEAQVRANPALFVKPRKVSVHGITFGMEKGKGAIEIADPEKTVKLIHRHFPEMADALIDTIERPAKGALEQLTAEQLKRVGAEIKGAGDRAVIRAADGETDKLVKALIKAAVAEEAAQ